jgi:hypothetical protein
MVEGRPPSRYHDDEADGSTANIVSSDMICGPMESAAMKNGGDMESGATMDKPDTVMDKPFVENGSAVDNPGVDASVAW